MSPPESVQPHTCLFFLYQKGGRRKRGRFANGRSTGHWGPWALRTGVGFPTPAQGLGFISGSGLREQREVDQGPAWALCLPEDSPGKGKGGSDARAQAGGEHSGKPSHPWPPKRHGSRTKTGSGLCVQGPHMHTRQAEPGGRQLLTPAALLEPNVQEEVTCVEEEESSEAGGLA